VNGIVDLFGRILLGFLNKVDTGFTRANVKKINDEFKRADRWQFALIIDISDSFIKKVVSQVLVWTR